MYKVTVLGGEGVGKTALIIQFLSQTFVESVRKPRFIPNVSLQFV